MRMADLGIRLESGAFFVYVAVLAWAPFPLGSNRLWSAALLLEMIALAWITWACSTIGTNAKPFSVLRRIAMPSLLAAFALTWGVLQILPAAPSSWVHPIWTLAARALDRPLPATVSLTPWRSAFELLKICGFVSMFWLACMFAQRRSRAVQLLDSIIAICAAYAAYALLLWSLRVRQFEIFYSTVPVGDLFSGPFVLHNSYATFAGLGSVCALARLFWQASIFVRRDAGRRQFLLSLGKFVSGRQGAPYMLAFALTFSTLIFSASRAGFVAFLFALAGMMVCAIPLARRAGTVTYLGLATAVAGFAMFVLFIFSGDTLQTRFDLLVGAGGPDTVRRLAWESGIRMIESSPWRGLGLGSFEAAYPLYANQSVLGIIDKAHNDYIEFAAGFGLPAAAAFILSIIWLAGLCFRAIFVRRRDRAFAVIAVSSSALVGLHSAFDFSLQIPAIAVLYAAILGLGVGQAFSHHRSRPT